MTTPSGALTMQDVITELGQTSVGGFGMERSDVRALAHVSQVSGTPYSMSSLRSRRCVNGTVTIGRNEPFNNTYGFDVTSSVYGSMTPAALDGFSFRQFVRLSSGGLQVLWAAAKPNVHAILLRATTASIAGTLPTTVALTSSAIAVGLPGDPFLGWNWGSNQNIDNWVNLLGQTVNIQFIMN